jgi:hypothetical protein
VLESHHAHDQLRIVATHNRQKAAAVRQALQHRLGRMIRVRMHDLCVEE